MDIYLAGSCGSESRTVMMGIATELRSMGFSVYCPFELKIPNAWNMSQEEWARKVFDEDVKAINACDTIVLISVGRVSTAGTNWEQGYAYGIGKPCHVFQITEEQTSLMTFCGCSTFTNTSIEEMTQAIKTVLTGKHTQTTCKTILT